ncbi:MAG: hypothetical protein IT385_25270 [Deltaproteobacteria bacterium]|nr:hypothetical protein [Deltaproteobacteria bacterium]
MRLTHILAPSVALAALPLVACDEAEDACAKKTPGTICTVIGTHVAGLGDDGLDPLDTDLYLPQDVSLAPNGDPYVVDWNNHRLRVVEDGAVRTVVGTGYLGDALDPSSGKFEGPALEINLNHPTHILFATNGDMIISAWHNSQVLRYVAETGMVERVCGTGKRAFNGDDKPAYETDFDLPVAAAWTPDGAILISDQANQRIRRVDGRGATATVTTVFGNGTKGYSGDGGPALEATIHLPTSQSAPPAGRIVTDTLGQIYLADTVNNVVRKVDTDGMVSTLAGTGEPGNGADGVATACALNTPADVAVDGSGNVFIADTMNSCVRRVDTAGRITTVAGQCGKRGNKGDGGQADKALLDRPYGVEVASDGTLWIADTHNQVVRVVYPAK